MNARKLTCLVLAFVFALATFVPATAGDTPPPGSDDNSIHPWDNSDSFGARGGHTEVHSRPIVFWVFGPLQPAVMVFSRVGDRSAAEPVTVTRTPERAPLRATTTRFARR